MFFNENLPTSNELRPPLLIGYKHADFGTNIGTTAYVFPLVTTGTDKFDGFVFFFEKGRDQWHATPKQINPYISRARLSTTKRPPHLHFANGTPSVDANLFNISIQGTMLS